MMKNLIKVVILLLNVTTIGGFSALLESNDIITNPNIETQKNSILANKNEEILESNILSEEENKEVPLQNSVVNPHDESSLKTELNKLFFEKNEIEKKMEETNRQIIQLQANIFYNPHTDINLYHLYIKNNQNKYNSLAINLIKTVQHYNKLTERLYLQYGYRMPSIIIIRIFENFH